MIYQKTQKYSEKIYEGNLNEKTDKKWKESICFSRHLDSVFYFFISLIQLYPYHIFPLVTKRKKDGRGKYPEEENEESVSPEMKSTIKHKR